MPRNVPRYTNVLTTRVDDNILNKVQAIAKQANLTVGEYLRKLVVEAIQ